MGGCISTFKTLVPFSSSEPPNSVPPETLDVSEMSTVYHVGPTWGGFASIRHLIILWSRFYFAN
jgi:hypothetical protein